VKLEVWVSPEGVHHQYQAGYPCFTCGRSHDDPSVEFIDQAAEAILSETEGDLDKAIIIADMVKYALQRRNIQQPYLTSIHIPLTYEYRIDW
jgi:hypothetical protein